MCELNRCPYEDDDEIQCEWCSHNDYWEDSDFEDFDDLQKEVMKMKLKDLVIVLAGYDAVMISLETEIGYA